MNESVAHTDMGDEEKRHRIVPLVVGSVSVPDPNGGAQHKPLAMLLTIDIDAVPDLREIFRRQQDGEEFDVRARWAAAMDRTGTHPPNLVLDFYLPEFDLGIAIYIDVDEHPKSIQAAILTGRAILVDPERSVQLQEEDEIGTALDELRVFTVQPPDPKPAIGVLQQRFNFPRPTYEPERQAVTAENSEEVAEEFFADSRVAAGAAVYVRGDGPSSIIIVDPESAVLKDRIPDGTRVEGRWGVIAGGEHVVLAFDAMVGAERLGRWLIADPPEELVRAGSNGAHSVAVVSELSTDDQDQADRQWREAIHAWVSHVEALRALRLGQLGQRDTETDA